jgi:hypothetical protein
MACFDIPGAFLHTDSNKDITMVLKARLAKLMAQVAPNLYQKYITVDKKNTAILYVKSLDEDNWGKVKHVLSYLKGMLHMPLILSADLLTLNR